MPYFTRNGVRLCWTEAGDPVGFPVVLHTGGAGDGSMWQDGGYVEPLAEFRLLLFDHRGHGSSDRPGRVADHRIEEYVADAAMLADAAGLDRYAFVGYSFGGAVGLRLAVRDPRMRSLVALGTIYEPPGQVADSAYEEPAQVGMAALAEMIEQSEGILLSDALRAQFLETDAEQFRLMLAAAEPDPWDELTSVAQPALLLAGAKEDPDAVQDAMVSRMPSARSVHLPGCGHVGAFLRPRDTTAAALPLLRAAASSP